jgi:hypothetical protein
MQTIYEVKVKGTEHVITIETEKIGDDLMAYTIQKGFEALMGRGRGKLGKASDHKSKADYDKEAILIAERQLEDLYGGKTRRVGGRAKSTKAETAVKAEMVRIAKVNAKDYLKGEGYKVTRVSAADLKAVADALIASDPETYRKTAEANLAASQGVVKPTTKLDLSFVQEDAKKVAKAEAAKEAAKAKKAAKAEASPKGVSPPPLRAKPAPRQSMRQ